jgi:hypothetical protein
VAPDNKTVRESLLLGVASLCIPVFLQSAHEYRPASPASNKRDFFMSELMTTDEQQKLVNSRKAIELRNRLIQIIQSKKSTKEEVKEARTFLLALSPKHYYKLQNILNRKALNH